jgi:hypothetical protein
MNKFYFFILLFTAISCTKKAEETTVEIKNPAPVVVTYTYTQAVSTSPMVFLGNTKNIISTDFNLNQYLSPIWSNMGMLFSLESLKKANTWIGITTTLVNDFNNDGFQDLFISFMGSENESIPFKLFLYDINEKKLVDKSDFILENIGQSFNRKAMCADLNGDKILDFICVSHPEANNMDLSYFDVVMSEGQKWKQKRIKLASRLKSEGYFHGFSIGDVDNDKDVDIILGMWHNPKQGITTFLNDGKGDFIEKKSIIMSGDNLPEENMSFTQELSDINNDNCLDLIYWGTQNTYIKFGNCDGTFGGNYLKLNQSYSWDYKFVDLDQDNLKDLIIFYSENTRKIIFYKNQGSITKPTFSKINELSVDFFTSYIDLKDINNDGKIDIIPAKFFDGNIDPNFTDGKTSGFYPKNSILLGQGGFNFISKVYPILTPIEAINFDLTSKKISWVSTFLPNVDNPFLNPLTMDNLRGDVNNWVIYLSSTPIVNVNTSQVKRILIPHSTIEKQLVASNTFNFSYLIEKELLDVSFIRIGYLDNNGVESSLSYEVKIERKAS